jgi:hypothetical protein
MRTAQSRLFWKLLQLMRRIRFGFRKRVLSTSEKYVSTNTAGHILLDMVRLTLPPLLLALGTAFALLISEMYLPTTNWKWSPIPLWHLEDRDSYGTFLSTISGIGGVLIGLYYTGLTAVGSAAYAQAPGTLRNLLLREPVGKLYMSLLSYTTFVSLCLLAFYGIGFSPVRFAIPFLILLSGVTILSFVQLGQQAFYFFDPTRLAGPVFVDLERWVKRATVDSRFWEDPSFQTHANQQAASSLKTLTTLADYASLQKYLKSDAIASLGVSTVRFLYRYERARQLIPSESKWYPSEYQHPDFYAAGDLKVDMALRTGGTVEPATSAQSDWIQEAALPVVFKALQANLAENDEASVFRILSALRAYIEELSEKWEIKQAIVLIERIADVVAAPSFAVGETAGDSRHLGLVENVCLLPISALLGFVKALEKNRLQQAQASLARIRWNRPETMYRVGFPRFVLPTLEWFGPRLEFEVMAEGRTVTPAWFIKQAVAKDCLIALHESIELLVSASERLYDAWYKRSTDGKNQWAAAVVLNRKGEYLLKLQLHFDKVVADEKEFETAKVLQDILGWPSTKAEDYRDRMVALGHQYDIAVAKEAHRLIENERPSHLPDFAGEFLSRTALTVLEAVLRNDVATFQAVFPLFFEASLKKTQRLLKLPSGGDQSAHLLLAEGPLLDLLELSGFAIVVSELRESAEPWCTAKALWDNFLSDKKLGAMRISVLKAVLESIDLPSMVAPGEVLRTGWRTELHHLLKQVPTASKVSGGYGLYVEHGVKHASALIRILARETFAGFYRGIDVFSACYFVKLTGTHAGLRIRSSGLIDELEREQQEREEEDTEEKDANEELQ